MKTTLIFLVIAMNALMVMNTTAQNLKRKGMLGAYFYPDTPKKELQSLQLDKMDGILVRDIIPNTTAESVGLLPNDFITKINNTTITTYSDLAKVISTTSVGSEITFVVYRDKHSKTLKGIFKEKPKTEYNNATVLYDEFAFNDGFIRCFLKTPTKTTIKGTIYFIQGIGCFSMDNLPKNNPYYQLPEQLLDAGYQVFITEKAGMGDSKNSKHCSQMGFNEELSVFQEGYKKLLSYKGVQPNNVIVFGHSLGGIIAPILANQFKPKGVIVFGTGIISWKDYLLKAHEEQSLLMGVEKTIVEEQMKTYTPFVNELFENPERLEQFLKNEQYKDEFDYLGYEPNSGLFTAGRTLQYHRELSQWNLPKEWKKIQCPVLSMYGESDLPALSDVDHKELVAIVNKEHPGKATYKFVPKTNHSMQEVGTMEEFVAMMNKPEYESFAATKFNHKMVQDMITWCNAL